MYLSRLILNPRSRRVQKEIAEPYQMHRSIMRAFPDGLSEGDERVLFRLDSARSGALTLLVQSWGLPDWGWLSEPDARGYLLPVDESNLAVKPFNLQLAPGQTVAFRLRANPTVKHWSEDDSGEKKPKRVGLCREEEQIEWLKRKGDQSGFRVYSARASNESRVGGLIHRKNEEETHKLTLLAVQFDGLLQVADPDRLCEAIRQGIGSGKGLGFGLLSLARPA